MDIQKEDFRSAILTIFILSIWFVTLMVFDIPLLSIAILWIGMIAISITYFIIYRKNKRDMRLLKIRFFVSAIPIYPALGYYVYLLLNGQEVSGVFRFLPIGIIGTMLLLNASVIYIYSQRDT